MILKKILDYPFFQCYLIDKSDKETNKMFPENNIIVKYNPQLSLVSTVNVSTLPSWEIFNDLTYMFCKQSTKFNEKTLTNLYRNIIGKQETENTVKYCGLNSCEQSLFTKDNNVILQLYSLENKEYPITFLQESVNIVTNYDDIKKLNKDKLKTALNNIVDNNSVHVSNFVEFIKMLNQCFPLNYGGTLRRFEKIIDFSKINQKDTSKVNQKDISKVNQKDTHKSYDYYIGYDLRFSNSIKENELVHIFEDLSYDDKNKIIICETYNNSIKDIIKQCKQKKIKYSVIDKYTIKINNEDYDKLKFITTIADFI